MKRKQLMAIGGLVVAAAMLTLGACASQVGGQPKAAADVQSTSTPPQATVTEKQLVPTTLPASTEVSTTTKTVAKTSKPPACPTSWAMSDSLPANHNWVTEGVPEIASAKTDKDAKKAADAWLDAIKSSPALLDGAAAYLLPGTKVDVKTLTDAHGCASTSAVALVQQLGMQIAMGTPKVSEAPAHAYNSGTDAQGVIANGDPGISGNRKAVQLKAKDGTDVWIMARCGNAVRPGPPPVRHKPPKTPPPVTSTHTPPPPTTVPTCVKFPPPNGDYNDYTWSWGVCNWQKKPQSEDCQQNGGPNCPPNPAHQPAQSPGNSVQSTATQTPAGVPTTAPKPLPTYTPPKSAPHAPPTTNNSSGYTPPSSTAPAGGNGPTSGPATTVGSPKPDPTPSTLAPTSDPIATGTPAPPS